MKRLLLLNEQHKLVHMLHNGLFNNDIFLLEELIWGVVFDREILLCNFPATLVLRNHPIELQLYCLWVDRQYFFVQRKDLCIQEHFNPAFHVMIGARSRLKDLAGGVEEGNAGRVAIRENNEQPSKLLLLSFWLKSLTHLVIGMHRFNAQKAS
jgi:hypothetical protein